MMNRANKKSKTERNLVNIFFLLAVLVTWAIQFLPMDILERIIDSNIIVNSAISELMIVIPALLMLIVWYFIQIKKEAYDDDYTAVRISDRLMYRSVKPTTILMSILYTFTILPLVTLFNLLTMLFVDNTVLEYSVDIIDMSIPAAIFTIAILPAMCEEFAFRGFAYGGYRRECRPAGAILMSAFLFGLIHGNLNQFAYAFVIGIALALLVEATGSIWPSILVHFIINSRAVVGMFLLEHIQSGIFEEYLNGNYDDSESMLVPILIYSVLSVITTLMAGAIISWISEHEGRSNPLKAFTDSKLFKASRVSVWSLALIIGIIGAVAEIVRTEIYAAM